jgi:hypothetical protein
MSGRARPGRLDRGARRAASLIATLAVASTVVGCGVGTGTLRIDAAEAAILDAAQAVAEEVGLGLPGPAELGAREQCELRSGGAGLRNRVRISAPVDDPTEAFELAAAALVSEGFLVVDSGVPGTLLAQRDGMSITIGSEPGAARAGLLALDALTGCRPR